MLCYGNVLEENIKHKAQIISDLGCRQAEGLRRKLAQPTFDLVLHSPFNRARDTAIIVAGLDENQQDHTISIPVLFYDQIWETGGRLSRALGRLPSAPLSEYEELVPRELNLWVHLAQTAIQLEIKKAQARRVLIVGHRILIPALGKVLTGEHDIFEKRVLEECQGWKIVMRDNELLAYEFLD